jgi:hypothetical protein
MGRATPIAIVDDRQPGGVVDAFPIIDPENLCSGGIPLSEKVLPSRRNPRRVAKHRSHIARWGINALPCEQVIVPSCAASVIRRALDWYGERHGPGNHRFYPRS